MLLTWKVKVVNKMFYTVFSSIIAGIVEIGGGYLIWLRLREGKPVYLGIFGSIASALYGVIATFPSFSSCGRIYAAFGGIFITLSVIWGELIKIHWIATTGGCKHLHSRDVHHARGSSSLIAAVLIDSMAFHSQRRKRREDTHSEHFLSRPYIQITFYVL